MVGAKDENSAAAAGATAFGELVLFLGDLCIPHKRAAIPAEMEDLINTDKISHVICTGNLGSDATLERVRRLAAVSTVVRGDIDAEGTCGRLPEAAVVTIRNIRFGVVHGWQCNNDETFLDWQQKLDCDVLVHGNNSNHFAEQLRDPANEKRSGCLRICPGSITGAPDGRTGEAQKPSFMLLSLKDGGCSGSILLYVYVLDPTTGNLSVTNTDLTPVLSSKLAAH